MKQPIRVKAYRQVVGYTHAELPNGSKYWLLKLDCEHSARYPRCRKYPYAPPKRLRCVACKRLQQGLAPRAYPPTVGK